MNAPNRARIGTLLSAAIATVLASSALADVTVEERMSVKGSGLMSMANMSGTTVTMISGQRARTESEMQFESGLMRTFARGAGKTAEIVRLDEDKMYTLDLNKKTYTERTFAEQRAQMQQAMEQMRSAQQGQQQSMTGVDESKCEWQEPTAEVKRTGEQATIAGQSAERVTVIATQSCKDVSTGQVCDFGLMLDSWMAPNFPGGNETLAYQRAFAEKMGMNAVASKDFAERAESMFGRYQGIWTEVSAKMQGIDGYSVKSSFSFGVGGPQCQSAQQAQSQQAGAGGLPSLGGALGGALGGMFGRKNQPEPAPAAAPVAPMPNGVIPFMTVSTELVSVNTGAVNASQFEVPANFKKTAN